MGRAGPGGGGLLPNSMLNVYLFIGTTPTADNQTLFELQGILQTIYRSDIVVNSA